MSFGPACSKRETGWRMGLYKALIFSTVLSCSSEVATRKDAFANDATEDRHRVGALHPQMWRFLPPTADDIRHLS